MQKTTDDENGGSEDVCILQVQIVNLSSQNRLSEILISEIANLYSQIRLNEIANISSQILVPAKKRADEAYKRRNQK